MIFRELAGAESRARTGYAGTLADPSSWLLNLFGGGETSSGITVSETTARNVVAVKACVRVLAEAVSTTPRHLMRRLKPRGRERMEDDPRWGLLRHRANRLMASRAAVEAVTGHVALWGNGYLEVERDQGGRPIGLWPRRPDMTQPEIVGEQRTAAGRIVGGRLVYRIGDGLGPNIVPEDDMVHVVGLSLNGLSGEPPLNALREAVGLSQAVESYSGQLFSQGGRPGGFLKSEKVLGRDKRKEVLDAFREAHGGQKKAHRVGLLEGGLDWKEVGFPPEAAQMLATRRFQLEEIARCFGIPKHLLQDTEKSAVRANIEEEQRGFLLWTLRPWFSRWEDALSLKLLSDEERARGISIEHFDKDLLRGDLKARYAAYHQARQDGWMNGDEIRELEGLNPMPNGTGEIYFVPLNMIPAEQAAAGLTGGERKLIHGEEIAIEDHLPESRAAEARERRSRASAVERRRLRSAYLKLFRRDAAALVGEEVERLRVGLSRLVARGHGAFLEFLAEFYGEHEGYSASRLQPVVEAMFEAVAPVAAREVGADLDELAVDVSERAAEYSRTFGKRHAGSGRRQLEALVSEFASSREAAAEAIRERLDGWAETRAEDASEREATQAGAAIARWVYLAAGWSVLRWDGAGAECVFCQRMHGVTVEIHGAFVEPGRVLEGDEGSGDLEVKQVVGHPPLHGGCTCVVTAG